MINKISSHVCHLCHFVFMDKMELERNFALVVVIIEDHEKAFLYSDIFMFFLSFEN